MANSNSVKSTAGAVAGGELQNPSFKPRSWARRLKYALGSIVTAYAAFSYGMTTASADISKIVDVPQPSQSNASQVQKSFADAPRAQVLSSETVTVESGDTFIGLARKVAETSEIEIDPNQIITAAQNIQASGNMNVDDIMPGDEFTILFMTPSQNSTGTLMRVTLEDKTVTQSLGDARETNLSFALYAANRLLERD